VRRVLVVDEESSMRGRLARDLERFGCQVSVSDDVEAAARIAPGLNPALAVLELRLGSGSGMTLLERLRPALPGTRFVVLTNFGSVASAVRAIRLGAADYLCKPASAEQVLAAAGGGDASADLAGPTDDGLQPLTLDQAIWEYIHQTLEQAGSLSEAARRLGLWRQSLKRKIAKYRPADAQPPRRSSLGTG